MFVFMCFGVFFGFYRGKIVIIIFSLLLASHLSLHLIIGLLERYRLTALPIMFILAVYGCSELIKIGEANLPISVKKEF